MSTGENRTTEIYRNQGPMYGSFMLNYWMNWQVSAKDSVVISLGKFCYRRNFWKALSLDHLISFFYLEVYNLVWQNVDHVMSLVEGSIKILSYWCIPVHQCYGRNLNGLSFRFCKNRYFIDLVHPEVDDSTPEWDVLLSFSH